MIVARNPDWHVIRGLACPFGVSTWRDGANLSFCKGAFDLSTEGVEVRLFDHHSHNVAVAAGEGGLRLWQNETGLCFEVAIPPLNAQSALNLIQRPGAGCSVALDADEKFFEWQAASGQRYRCIEDAGIDHIAIVPNPSFPTRAWGAADEAEGRLSAELAELAAACAIGRDEPPPGSANDAGQVAGSCTHGEMMLRAAFARRFYVSDPDSGFAFLEGRLQPPEGAYEAWLAGANDWSAGAIRAELMGAWGFGVNAQAWGGRPLLALG